MLASVNSIDEALLVEAAGVDIIDLKQPARGALGALDIGDVKRIVDALCADTVVSATIGDLPMQADIIGNAAENMAATGVDYVKIGFFPGGDWSSTLKRLSALARYHDLIAVLFADASLELAIIDDLQQAGFRGVMLDTANKSAGSLRQLVDETRLTEFVARAKVCGLLTGLAGSLRVDDIDDLVRLKPDYLGFRGALCHQLDRSGQVDGLQVHLIRRRLLAAIPRMETGVAVC